MNAQIEDHVLVLGAGGHAKVVSEILVDSGMQIAGFVTLDCSVNGLHVGYLVGSVFTSAVL